MPFALRSISLAIPLVAAAVGLIAVVAPELAVVLALALGFGTLTLADLRIGACVFAFSCVLLDGVAAGNIAADKVVAGAIVLSWIASLAARSDLREEIVAHTPIYLVVVLLVGAWYTASCIWADDPSQAAYQLVRLLPNLLVIPIIVSAVNDARTLRWLIGSLLAGVLFSAVYGLITHPVHEGAEGRLAGYGLDANGLALWSVMSAALAYGIVASRVELAVRAVTVLAIAFCGVVVLQTGSRAGLVDLGFSLLLAPLLLRRGHRLVALAALVITAGTATIYFTTFADDVIKDRLALRSVEDASGRTSIWRVGLRMVEANPVGGVGGGNFRTSSIHYLLEPGYIKSDRYIILPRAAHNTYLQVVAEVGIVGALLFFSALALSVLYTVRAVSRFRAAGLRDLEVLARGVLLAYLGVLVGMLSISVDVAKPLWLLLALGPLLMKLVRVNDLPPAARGGAGRQR